jgi:hypothetical protein
MCRSIRRHLLVHPPRRSRSRECGDQWSELQRGSSKGSQPWRHGDHRGALGLDIYRREHEAAPARETATASVPRGLPSSRRAPDPAHTGSGLRRGLRLAPRQPFDATMVVQRIGTAAVRSIGVLPQSASLPSDPEQLLQILYPAVGRVVDPAKSRPSRLLPGAVAPRPHVRCGLIRVLGHPSASSKLGQP